MRVSFTLPQDTAPVAEWAPKNGIKKVVTLVSDYAPGHDAEIQFLKTFKEGGGEILESRSASRSRPPISRRSSSAS